jgi:hypothetical protein
MKAKSMMPGFTAEDAITKPIATYRATAGFYPQGDVSYVKPAMKSACENILDAYLNSPVGSVQELVFKTILQTACGWR